MQKEGIVICVNRVHKNVAIFSTIWVIKLRERRVLQNVSHSIREQLCSGMQLFRGHFATLHLRGCGEKNNQSYSLSWVIVTTYVTHNHKMFSNKNCFVVSCENNIIIHTNSFLHSDLRRWHFLRARVDGPQAEASLQHVKEWRIKSTLSFIKSAPLGPWLNFLGQNWCLSVKCTSEEFIDLGHSVKQWFVENEK